MDKTSIVSFESSLNYQKLPIGETLAYRSQITSSVPTESFLLVHGWLCSSLSIWDDLVVLLSDFPINIYAVDMSCFGDFSYIRWGGCCITICCKLPKLST